MVVFQKGYLPPSKGNNIIINVCLIYLNQHHMDFREHYRLDSLFNSDEIELYVNKLEVPITTGAI